MAHDTYALLDFGDGSRLEQWGPYRLIRPDPTAVGAPLTPAAWTDADVRYEGLKGQGQWRARATVPAQWPVTFDDLQLWARLTPYKHTGIFPEQQQNWRWARSIARSEPLDILSLFAYSGAMTVALARDGHHVTHVDASQPALNWARDNALLNGVPADRVRWIRDDAARFAARELRRGRRYGAVILDPPAYGHGPGGRPWRVARDLAPLLSDCAALLADRPAFLLLNGYATQTTAANLSALCSAALQSARVRRACRIDSRELHLQAATGAALSTGVVARCSFDQGA